jgi:hypothetical protein
VFGYACWPNLRAYNDKKLSFRTSKCVFIGYSSSHKGYKCLDQSIGRIYISRDVVFDENIFPFEDSKASATPRTTHHPVLLPTLTKPTTYTEQSLIDTQIPVLTEPIIDNSHLSDGQDNYATNGDPGVSMSPAGDEAAHSSAIDFVPEDDNTEQRSPNSAPAQDPVPSQMTVNQHPMRTRLRDNIIQTKEFNDGTIIYPENQEPLLGQPLSEN